MWRPDNWREKREEYYVYGEFLADGTYEDDYTAGFEVGADAMLEALRGDAASEHYEAGQGEEIYFIAEEAGYLVFIPDEKADDKV
jgi:hypothetical protein